MCVQKIRVLAIKEEARVELHRLLIEIAYYISKRSLRESQYHHNIATASISTKAPAGRAKTA